MKIFENHRFINAVFPAFVLLILAALGLNLYVLGYGSSDSAPPDEAVLGESFVSFDASVLPPTPDLSGIEIPILMYHYIRDYDDVSDPVGLDLSVSPETFARQLSYLESHGYTPITFWDVLYGDVPEKPIVLTFDDGYLDFYTNALPVLQEREMKAVVFPIGERIGTPDYMTREQLRELARLGHEVGSHTVSHPDLRTESAADLRLELSESKKILREITGEEVISFCYPAGQYYPNTLSFVEEAGYRFAIGIVTPHDDWSAPLEIPRYRVREVTELQALGL